MDFLPSLDDIRLPIEIEEPKKKGGWDFDGDFEWKPEPEIPPPEDWPIYGPPTPGAFEGMFDGYEEEVVPPLGITEEELSSSDPGPIHRRTPGPIESPDPGCATEPRDRGGPGGGMVNPAIEALPDDDSISTEEHRQNVANDPYGYFRDLY
jgi:hypothetical protein